MKLGTLEVIDAVTTRRTLEINGDADQDGAIRVYTLGLCATADPASCGARTVRSDGTGRASENVDLGIGVGPGNVARFGVDQIHSDVTS